MPSRQMMQGMRNAFDQAKKDRYKAALARAGGGPMSNNDIVSIKQVHASMLMLACTCLMLDA